MSKLVWDATGDRIYETGIDHVILFVQNSAATETNGYDNGVAWNGVTAVTESPSGADSNDIYADNIKYLSLLSAEDFGATIEAYTYPDEWEVCDGSAEPATGVRIYQQSRKGFALFYRTIVGNDVDGNDYGYKYHIIYNCKASPSERGYQTVNDSPEAISFSYEITTTPIAIDAEGYKPTARITIDTTKFTTEDAKAKLKTFLDTIEGSENADSKILLPDQIISMFQDTPTPTPTTHTVAISPASATIAIGETQAYTVTVDGEAYSGTVTYTSANTEAAEFDDAEHPNTVTAKAVAENVGITASVTIDGTAYTDTASLTIEQGEG